MLAGRSQRTAWRRGHPFLSERRDGILVYEGFLRQPIIVYIGVSSPVIFPMCISYHLRLSSTQRNSVYTSCVVSMYAMTLILNFIAAFKSPTVFVRADCLATNTEYCDRCTHAATQATNVARIKTEGTKGLLQGQVAG
jgi:hypothetical protein